MAISGLGCRVCVLLLAFTFPLITGQSKHIENKVSGGFGRDTVENHENHENHENLENLENVENEENGISIDRFVGGDNLKVGLIYDTPLPRNITNETKRLSGQSGWNEGKRDAGSEDKQEFSNSRLKKDSRKPANGSASQVGKSTRKEDVFKMKSRSSGGGKALSPHDERAGDGEVTKFIADNHERNGIVRVSTHCNRKSNVCKCDNGTCGRANESNQTVDPQKVDLIRGQRRKRDINLADSGNEDQISDRVSIPFAQRPPPTGITVIHPGRGGIMPVFSPELQPEEMSANRKQDMFMSFHPIVFQPMFSTSVEMRPHQQRPMLHQRPVVNQNHHQQTRFRFPQQAFRTPHLVNNGNVQMINTNRPAVVHEFRPRPQHHTFFSGPHFNPFNHSTLVRPNTESRPFFERPEPQNHQIEGLRPGSVVFEPQSEHQPFQRPRIVEPNNPRRPVLTEEQGPWNAFMQLIQKNPKRPRFPDNQEPQVDNFNRFPRPTEPPHQVFNPVTGQQIITRLPVQTIARPHSNFDFEMTTHAHPRPLTTPRPQNHHQIDVDEFFIPSTDSLPFDFPSRFTESNQKNNEQFVQNFNHHSSQRPNHFTQQLDFVTQRPNHFQQQPDFSTQRPNHFSHITHSTRSPEHFRPTLPQNRPFHHTVDDNRSFRPLEVDDNRSFRPLEVDDNRSFRPLEVEGNRHFRPNQQVENTFRPTERPKLTTPTRPKLLQKPVPLERPITQRPIPRPILTRPAQVTDRPSFSTTSQHTTNDHSQFTHSFVPSTIQNNNFEDEGFTRKPDPAIIPPKPPFLKENLSPLYFIPPLKPNRTSTTLNPDFFNLKTSHSTDFPIRNTFTNQQTSVELTTSRDLQQSTASQVPINHSNQQFIDDDFTRPELIEETTWQSRPIDIVTDPTTHTPPTTVHSLPTLRKPSFIEHSDNGGMPLNKFLTPFVKFKEPEVTSQKSFIPNSAVKVTPKAVATPEFSPSLKPASQSHFTVSTTEPNFPEESIIGEEFDSLMTPSRPDDPRQTDFVRTSTFLTTESPPSTFFDGPSQGIEEDDDFGVDDGNFNTENSISWQPTFTTPFRPETSLSTTTNTPMQFHPIKGPGLRFPLHIQTSTKPSLIPNAFRPTTFRPPLNVNQFTQLDHGRLPESDVNTPLVGSTATTCNAEKCQLPNCFCGSNTRLPGDLSANEVPQLILLTFDDDVNEVNWNVYKKVLYSGRRNPNGCPVQATFYISHEWTDYSKVNTLYLDGHEIASHSISHPDGASYSKQQWKDEIQGQREILSFMGGVPIQQIQGMRAPFLAVGGNKMFGMLYESNFTYDSSLPVPIHDPPLWPYTLDYALGHDCMIPPCPRKSFPGVWEIPMIMWVDLKGGRCSMADACSWPDTKEKVFEQLVTNFQRHYKSNRAPFNLFFHSAWFDKPQNIEGFLLFMDRVLTLPDVYFVTSMQAIEWMRQPTSVREIHSFVPFSCHLRSSRGSKCKKPRQCQLRFKGETRYVQSCQECPAIYPWIKNPFGKQL